MSSRLRVASLAVAALVAVPAVSACNTSPGSAALVGGTRITTGDLQDAVNASLADATVQGVVFPSGAPATQKPAEKVAFVQQTLARLIGDQIIDDLAAAHHVTATQQEVQAQINTFVQQAGSLQALQQTAAQQIGVGAAGLNGLIKTTVLQQKLGQALTANLTATQAQLEAEYQKDIDTYDQLQIAQIAVQKKGLARHILKTVKSHPNRFATLAKKYSIDTQTAQLGGIVGYVGRSQVVQLLGSAKQAKPHSYVLAHSSNEYVVLHIIKRQLQPLSEVTDQVKQALFSSQEQTLVGKAVSEEARKLGVHVSPRYGAWDNANQSVVPIKSSVSSSG